MSNLEITVNDNLDPMNEKDFALISAAVKAEYLRRNFELLAANVRESVSYSLPMLVETEVLVYELENILRRFLPEDVDNEVESSWQINRGNKSVRDDWHDR